MQVLGSNFIVKNLLSYSKIERNVNALEIFFGDNQKPKSLKALKLEFWIFL